MDQDRFDRIARLLGAAGTRRDGLRAALGGLLGTSLAAALDVNVDAGATSRRDDDAGAGKRRRRKTCKPACADGFECVKVGRKRVCQCLTGDLCGGACCRIGQTCQDGQCVAEPEPGQCIAAGEPCKNVGRPCCDGRTCSSGQGGERDVACYVPKTGPCDSTADCVYGMRCSAGRCAPPQPGDLAQPCDAAAQQLCTTPGAVCAAYTGTDAPAGAFCSLPLQKTCTGDPDCTCYKCWYTAATVNGSARRTGRASTNTKACCHQKGLACSVDQDCCLGLSCTGGICGGQLCTPDNARGCGPDAPCCNEGNGASCQAGVCETCGPATCPNGCCRNGQCILYGSQGVAACGAAGAACAACPTPTNTCKQATCSNAGVCGEANKPANAVCDRNGGTANGYCNGSGTCVECTSAGQCTNTVGTCKVRACTAGACGEANATVGTVCDRNSGTNNGYCNGSGTCVQCTNVSQCTNTVGACKQRACTAGVCGEANVTNGTACTNSCVTTPTCTNGICGGTPLAVDTACTRDGGGSGVCNQVGRCVECTTVSQCTNTVGECQTKVCSVAGVCGASNKRDGTSCSTGGTTCAAGVCGPCTATSCPDGCCDGTTCDRTGLKCRQSNGTCAGTACPTGQRCGTGTCTACDVCASGCPYETVADAVADEANKPAGSTITVAPGTYLVSSSIMVNRSLTIRVCEAESGVVLETPAVSESSLRAGADGVTVFKLLSGTDAPQNIALTVSGIAFQTAGAGGAGRAPRAGGSVMIGIEALPGAPSARRVISALGCTFVGLDVGIRGSDHADITLGNVAVRNSAKHAVYVVASPGNEGKLTATAAVFSGAKREVLFLENVDTTLTDCVVEGGAAYTAVGSGAVGGGVHFESNKRENGTVPTSATLTLAGDTSVRGNLSYDIGGGGGGGGIVVIAAYNGVASLVMTGASSITGNATNGHGSGVLYLIDQAGSVSATGTETRVYGNIGPNAECEREIIAGSAPTFTPLATCTP